MSGRHRAVGPAPRDRARPSDGSRRMGSAIFVALLGHGALLVVALELPPPVPSLVDVTEVELMPPAAAASEPPQPVESPKPALAEPATPKALAPRPRSTQRATPPASAASLRTVEESVQTGSEPVRFVTDPNGEAFGFGTVARGGTAPSAQGAVARDALPSGPSSRAVSLSRPPRLAESDPCRGFFPDRARVDRGDVTLKVRVERDGSVRSIAVLTEAPLGHGFGFAARDCLHSKRFLPALDRAGLEVAVVSPITVRFTR
jgi:outer membrane biosynthesis protein TonB